VREGKGVAELCISDRGPGVPDAELEFLFRPFFRGSNAARADGHGMGLAIVQRVVQVHGGDIYASNGLRGGLEVHLQLPLAGAA
jgi:signal transduction histidine kinase